MAALVEEVLHPFPGMRAGAALAEGVLGLLAEAGGGPRRRASPCGKPPAGQGGVGAEGAFPHPALATQASGEEALALLRALLSAGAGGGGACRPEGREPGPAGEPEGPGGPQAPAALVGLLAAVGA
ncbi:hypothetical protein [Thermus amyloliquefaciens]|uniref:hypothetical protein n=1 Tax=Thermus amyloliquefaciens TaxID=1449080 RepID=UPI001FE219CD|nr:hypothetical protein [Thermus amyloliquefaciens]